MVVQTSMSGLWTEACASPGAPADEPGVQDNPMMREWPEAGGGGLVAF
jgi:hypothetical protein